MIDGHAHPFPLDYVPLAESALDLNLERTADWSAAEPDRLFVELLTGRLAGLLGTEPADAVAERDRRAAADWAGWLTRLLDDAGLAGLLFDDAVAGVPPADLAGYRELTGRPYWRISRVDPVVDELLAAGAGAREVLDAVEDFLARSAAAGCVGFKTILAYRTGLAVDPGADLAAADSSLDQDVPVRRRAKPLRDLVTRTLLARAADLGLPVQVHTGFGDSDLRLAGANPLLLEDVLDTAEGRAATVVLLHGSHPWEEAAAHLAAVRSNVHLDFSLVNLFAPLRTADRLLRLLELAPRSKLMLASDGHGAPETHWFGARILADCWELVAGELAAAGAGSGWIETARRALFDDNARALYRLEG